jgi:outer membrane protein
MKKMLFSSALAALALAAPVAAFAQPIPAAAIMIVDRDRIAQECNACKAASTTLQGMIASAQQRQQQLSQPLQTEGQAIQQAAAAAQKMPAGAAKTAADRQVQARAQAYQQRAQQAEQELQGLDQNIQSTRAHVTQQIIDKLNPIIVNVMRTRGASIAIDSDATLAHSPGIDVTNDVLAQFNTQVTSLSVTPMPQQAQPAPSTPGR